VRILILGASGMLGKALVSEGKRLDHEILAPTRREVNLLDDARLEEYIEAEKPEVIINSAAMIDHAECEENPRSAYMINARPVATLANVCRRLKIELVQISSDQCQGPLLNEYAKTKAAGEVFALSIPNSLVVRTNIVGPKNLAWAFRVIENDEPVTLYSNYTVSSIDIWSFSKALFEIIAEPSSGIINIGSRESFSKELFVQTLAEAMGFRLNNVISGTLPKHMNRYPDLKLDVSLAEKWLNYTLPTLQEVIDQIIRERQTQ